MQLFREMGRIVILVLGSAVPQDFSGAIVTSSTDVVRHTSRVSGRLEPAESAVLLLAGRVVLVLCPTMHETVNVNISIKRNC